MESNVLRSVAKLLLARSSPATRQPPNPRGPLTCVAAAAADLREIGLGVKVLIVLAILAVDRAVLQQKCKGRGLGLRRVRAGGARLLGWSAPSLSACQAGKPTESSSLSFRSEICRAGARNYNKRSVIEGEMSEMANIQLEHPKCLCDP